MKLVKIFGTHVVFVFLLRLKMTGF